MYYATGYIGRDFTPGEILPDDIDPKLLQRLLKSGMARAEDERAPEHYEDEPEDMPENVKGAAPEERADTEPEEAKESDEDGADEYEMLSTEPPVIDVMEGIVTGKKSAKRKGGASK